MDPAKEDGAKRARESNGPAWTRAASAGALLMVVAATLLTAGSEPAIPTGAQRTDWATFGFDSARTGTNTIERGLGPDEARRLHRLWAAELPAVTITSPLVANHVRVQGRPTTLVVVGTEHGQLMAFDAASGRMVWARELGSVRSACRDMPDGVFGISDTPVIDRATGRVYVAAPDGARRAVNLYALSLATGRTVPRWPVALAGDPVHMHVWGALTLAGSRVYAGMASLCDIPPSYGSLVSVDTATHRVVRTWYVVRRGMQAAQGGGIWGSGGATVDPATGQIFVATGNAFGPGPEDRPHAEQVVRLTPELQVSAAEGPPLFGVDVDFGGSPTLFDPAGCPPQLAVENKTGVLLFYHRDDLSDGPVQAVQIGANAGEGGFGIFIGMPAFDRGTGLLYVANPGRDAAPYRRGMVALSFAADCRPELRWQSAAGRAGTGPVSSPSVANGVVYYGDGRGGRVFAFDAATGRPLWNSGSALSGAVFAPPVPVDGRLFVASWDGADRGTLTAFGP